MLGDLLGFALSGLLIVLCMSLAYLVVKHGDKKFGSLKSEVARKIVHIGVSNWFFIYYYCFETFVWPASGLALFAVINFVLTANGSYSKIIGKESTKRSWGVVYYPLAVIVLLVLHELGVGTRLDVGCGLLGMGYGDGLAALIGAKYGKSKLSKNSKKTVLGSVTMLLVVAIILFAVKSGFGGVSEAWAMGTFGLVLFSLSVGLTAAIFEAVTPFGLDNISVPIVIYLMAGLV